MKCVSLLLASVSLASLLGCNPIESDLPKTAADEPQLLGTAETTPNVDTVEASARANALFDKIFTARAERSPVFLTYLGIKKDYDKWDNLSDAYAEESHTLDLQLLKALKQIDPSSLDAGTQLSFRLLTQQLENQIADYRWRYHNYPVNQMFGTHSEVPSLLINQHRIDSVADAEAYIARLNAVPQLFDQLIAGLEKRAKMGIIAPKFVFPYVINDSRNLLKGAPFEAGEDSTLLADFNHKLEALSLAAGDKQYLRGEAINALTQNLQPAYLKLIACLEDLAAHADTRAGAWKFPSGEAFYNNALQRTTTTELSANDIHAIGLREVARIHSEMRNIMKQVNFSGSLQAFFAFMRKDPRFYYPETEDGKALYLQEATALIDNMKSRLDELFITKPKADLQVKRVESFREKSAGKAFYERPAPDGSRPGLYYANLYTTADMPVYQMEALAYHEGIPGHHMQIAIAQELEQMPKFRRFGDYTAYIEGWGLYSELVPKEIGLYADPYSDFGRLAMELWRACRLVVDTGLHAKRWTREQAIDYLVENTPNSEYDAIKAIERYIVMPSQATAYKIGMLEILKLRAHAQQALGQRFDIRQFHDVVLRNGPVPLNVLGELVEQWIDREKLSQTASNS